MAVTLKDIADRLNVSVATVSCALRGENAGRFPLAVSTVELVRRTAEEMGYRRNLVASSLKRQKTQVVGVLLPDIESDYYRRIFRGIVDELADPLLPLVALHSYSADLERRFLDMMIGNRVDALIAGCSGAEETAGTYRELSDVYGIPTCLIDRGIPGITNAPVIRPNAHDGGGLGIDTLYRLGHRKSLIYGSFNDGLDSVLDLQQGVTDRCTELKIDLNVCSASIHQSTDDPAGTLVAFAREIISLWKKIRSTAILVNTDLLAYEIMRYASEEQIRIPADVSLMGMDDGSPSSLPGVELSTISARIEEIGRAAVATLRTAETEPVSGSINVDLAYKPLLRRTVSDIAPRS